MVIVNFPTPLALEDQNAAYEAQARHQDSDPDQLTESRANSIRSHRRKGK